jgi:GrpB-like predicted nucleotidyltransferase (UPF0157 family)
MVDLEPYLSSWPEDFRREAGRILAATAAQIDRLEHIGSTAVPGLTAKPIIDLAARLRPGVNATSLDEPLAGLGYRRHTAGPKTHGVFIRDDHGRRTHILHVFALKQWEHCNQRLFRDKLLKDPSARDRYQRLKLSIAELADGREYTKAKTELIEELLNEERASRELPPTVAWDK